jgi:hypothetical protein
MTAMNGLEILESLRSLGVTVQAAGPDRLRLEPASKIPSEMIPSIREAKPEILEALRTGLAACGSPQCAGCYDTGDGRKIHQPKIGEGYQKWLERWAPMGRPQ